MLVILAQKTFIIALIIPHYLAKDVNIKSWHQAGDLSNFLYHYFKIFQEIVCRFMGDLLFFLLWFYNILRKHCWLAECETISYFRIDFSCLEHFLHLIQA